MKEHMRILVSQEDGQYIGQVLEYDMVIQAPTIESLLTRVEMTLDIESRHCDLLGKKLDECVPPATQDVVDKWNAASASISAGEDAPFELKAA